MVLSATILKICFSKHTIIIYAHVTLIGFGRENEAEAEDDCDPQQAVDEQRPNVVQAEDSNTTSNRLAPVVLCASVLVEIYPIVPLRRRLVCTPCPDQTSSLQYREKFDTCSPLPPPRTPPPPHRRPPPTERFLSGTVCDGDHSPPEIIVIEAPKNNLGQRNYTLTYSEH